MKKARAWLAQAGVAHEFIDFKKQAPGVQQLKAWAAQSGWELLLNRAGTTWRKLDAATQGLASDEAGALALMATHPSLIKRPVVEWEDGRLSVGFKPEQFQALVEGR
ncbi:Spx/MgsR family transcriptional regulator [Inhella inkyongensis]|uniref:Spx/MgsR family transcriptional regulator n=1 Tax=Inhella inkyongensis TaxID=392593 RepID=A0A840S970_9BURK|nr:Spx/MgsR family transcriptional regulator [Inhella inkyongensis]